MSCEISSSLAEPGISPPPSPPRNIVAGSPSQQRRPQCKSQDDEIPPQQNGRLEPVAEENGEKEPAGSVVVHVSGEEVAIDDENPTAEKTEAVEAPVSRKRRIIRPELVRPARAAATRRARAEAKTWEAPFVFTDDKSPLATANIRDILLLPRAWEVLSKEERRAVLALFPDDAHILDAGTDEARPNLESLKNDNNFRHDCSRYCENIQLGKHDEQWLRDAWVAHGKRKRGDFDDFEVDKFEREWSVKLPPEYRPKRLREKGSPDTGGPSSPAAPRSEATPDVEKPEIGDQATNTGRHHHPASSAASVGSLGEEPANTEPRELNGSSPGRGSIQDAITVKLYDRETG